MRRAALAAGLLLAAAFALAALLAGGPSRCHARAPQGAGGGWLRRALADVPCPASGAAVYGARDDRGAPLDVLDPIADPRGGYLGVYHSPDPAAGRGSRRFEILLARSSDLIHWRRLRVLEVGASMPTLRAVPGGGYLLADERGGARDTVELHWFASLAAVLRGTPATGIDLPLAFSRFSNGTPAIVSVDWRGGLRRSRIGLSFHYESAAGGGRPGPDREAFGLLSGFSRWQPRRDTRTDALLERQGFPGNHGDERWFAYGGRAWRILEAQSRPDSFAAWRVLLYEPGRTRFLALTPDTRLGSFPTSFGNPTAQLLPAPGGHGQVLAVTMFVFSSGAAASEAGELVFFRQVP